MNSAEGLATCTTQVRLGKWDLMIVTITDTHKEYVFILGAAGMGFLALGAGFVRHQVALIILRALMGIGKSYSHSSSSRKIETYR